MFVCVYLLMFVKLEDMFHIQSPMAQRHLGNEMPCTYVCIIFGTVNIQTYKWTLVPTSRQDSWPQGAISHNNKYFYATFNTNTIT